MNAELVLFLMEEGMSMEQAKAVSSTEPANVPELALALIENGVAISEARGRAERAPLSQPLMVQVSQATRKPGGPTIVTGQVIENGVNPRNPANRMTVPVVGADGLTDAQRNAVAAGIGLCPNCQQPTNNHLPGCARASGEDPRATTAKPLPPVQ